MPNQHIYAPLQISNADMEFITKYVDADNDGRMSLRVRHLISRHTAAQSVKLLYLSPFSSPTPTLPTTHIPQDFAQIGSWEPEREVASEGVRKMMAEKRKAEEEKLEKRGG